MRCHDKLESRRIQAAAVPEATPAFAAVDLDGPDAPAPLPYPFFLKPVAAHLSQLAYRIDGPSDYAAALTEARATIDAVTAYDRRARGAHASGRSSRRSCSTACSSRSRGSCAAGG